MSGQATAHPRTRGEHSAIATGHSASAGSSPHTRGTQASPLERYAHDRLIPAHAGNTSRALGALAQRTAHPRTRGEHATLARRWIHSRGSSPHTRGTRAGVTIRRHRPRLIPAHAGNTGPH